MLKPTSKGKTIQVKDKGYINEIQMIWWQSLQIRQDYLWQIGIFIRESASGKSFLITKSTRLAYSNRLLVKVLL